MSATAKSWIASAPATQAEQRVKAWAASVLCEHAAGVAVQPQHLDQAVDIALAALSPQNPNPRADRAAPAQPQEEATCQR